MRLHTATPCHFDTKARDQTACLAFTDSVAPPEEANDRIVEQLLKIRLTVGRPGLPVTVFGIDGHNARLSGMDDNVPRRSLERLEMPHVSWHIRRTRKGRLRLPAGRTGTEKFLQNEDSAGILRAHTDQQHAAVMDQAMICEADLRTYAKGFHGRFGARAVAYARDYAEQLQAQGDGEGHDV